MAQNGHANNSSPARLLRKRKRFTPANLTRSVGPKNNSRPVATKAASPPVSTDDDDHGTWILTNEENEELKLAMRTDGERNNLGHGHGTETDEEYFAEEYEDERVVDATPDERAAEEALLGRLALAIRAGDTRTVETVTSIRPYHFTSVETRSLFSAVELLLGRGELPRHAEPLTHYLVAQYADQNLPFEQGRHLLQKAAERGAVDDTPTEVLVGRVLDQCRQRLIKRHAETLRADIALGKTDEHLSAITHYMAAEFNELEREAVVQQPIYSWVHSDELDSAEFRLDYLIEGTLVAGQTLVLGGATKAMKTSLMVDAAVSLASGSPFLGRLHVTRPCRVAVMSGESGLPVLQDIARRVCRARDISLADLRDTLVWTPDLPKLGSPKHLAALETDLRGSRAEVLAIDPMYLCMPGADAGNLHIQGEYLREIKDLCKQLGVTPILAHHTKRGTGHNPYEPAELSDLAWAGYAEFSRQWWLIARREKYEPGTGEHRLWLTVGGSAGHSALWALDICEGLPSDEGGRQWEVCVADAAGAREAAAQRRQEIKQQANSNRLAADQQMIVDALNVLPALTETKKGIRTATGLNSSRFEAALAPMVLAGRLVSTTITKGNNRSYEAYHLSH